MAKQFTEDEIRLAIGKATISNARLTVAALMNEPFGSDSSNASPFLQSFIRKEFLRQNKSICRFIIRNRIVEYLKSGSSDFIRDFIALRKKGQLMEVFVKMSDVHPRLLVLKEEEALGSLLIECSRLFDRLREKFAPLKDEQRFRNYLVQWFESGFMPLSIWKAWNEWNLKGPNLKSLRSVRWPAGTEKESNLRAIKKMLAGIRTDNFVEIKELTDILNIFLAKPNLTVKGDTVKVTGRSVYLSEWSRNIENAIRSHNATQVVIFAEDFCGLDCNLVNEIWQGKNLTVVSNKVYVWQSVRIRLSGVGFGAGKSKAASASSTTYRGADGKHGRPGESSGNIAILATEMYNSSILTLELNGGRGEDGQDGGDGCDGMNGVGVTRSDIDRLVVDYNSLYRDSWSNFHDYSPPSNWTKLEGDSSSGKYIYRKFKDEHGRLMTYSFAADKGYLYTTYELFFLITGSNGTCGTSGGSNGVGGQGGYNGTYLIQNPETGQDFAINVIRNGNNGGANGENGIVGISGKHGNNGNDLALIDRSAKEASKHYEGSIDRKLSWNYVYKAEYKSRLNGYLRYEKDESACFIKFEQGEKIDTSERRAARAQERTTRTSAFEAVARQSIIVSDILTEAQSLFGKENSFLADACEEAEEATRDDEETGEDEELAENVNEEVVMLRQKEEVPKLNKYTPESDKKRRSAFTPSEYVNHVKSVGRRTTVGTCAQILFDLFTLEFPPSLLDSIALPLVFHQSHFRQGMRSPFTLALVAALQSRLVNGKNFAEIKQFTQDLSARRTRKMETTRLRQKLQNLIAEVDSVTVSLTMTVIPADEVHFGIREGPLTARLAPFTDQEQVRRVVQKFYSKYVENEVSPDLLAAFNDFLKGVKEQYHQQFKLFAQNDDFKWTDKEIAATYLQSLQAWLDENTKKKKKSHDKDDKEHKTKGDVPEPPRARTKPEADFETLLKAVVGDLEYWHNLIKPINSLITNDPELTARFEKPPSFDGKGFVSSIIALASQSTIDEKAIKQTQHLIKIYWLAQTILKFNKRLYQCNAIMLKEEEKCTGIVKDVDDDDFDGFIAQRAAHLVLLGSDKCEVHMRTLGLACGAFRYLLSLHLNIRLCSYRKVSYQTLKIIEDLNPTANECEMLWLHEKGSPSGIDADKDIRRFVGAQQAVISKYSDELTNELDAYYRWDYSKNEGLIAFASFFPAPLQNAVIEWVENYVAITQEQSFLHMLHNRFFVDGCQLSVFELQFVLSSCANLKTLFHCKVEYLLLLANSVTQSELVDVFLYTRIQYHQGAKRINSSKIFTGIQLIPNTRHKALFAAKLNNYGSSVEEDDLYKVILMLQHASNGSEQLIKIGFDEWIAIAQKQKWSEIGYLLKQYGSIGYYLGILDSKGLKEQEKRMRAVFDEISIIPEKLIALYTNLIIMGDFTGDETFFDQLKQFLVTANQFPELENKLTKHQLVTSEAEQARLINWIVNRKVSDSQVSIERLIAPVERNVDVLMEKITGLHDPPEELNKRRECIRNTGRLLKSNDQRSANISWLSKFDDALYKLKKMHLRDTQKMAVLCAVESDKHVLEQVNTGEGKSFIIAAIAVIHCKTGKRFVDVITSSPVLAQRDAAEMSELYNYLGVSVADNCSEDLETRKKAYSADIVYGDIARFQRDYLLHTFYKKPIMGDRTRVAVIVDEVDNMLLDNGNNMLYLSHSVPGMDLLDSLLIFIQQQIHSPIYNGDKCNIEDMQAQFDNAAIKKKILADLFGNFSLVDLTTIAGARFNELQIKAIYEQLIEGKIIDIDGYLKIHRYDQVPFIKEKLQSYDAALVLQIQACFGVILSRERRIELPSYLRGFAKLHLDELIENSKHALFLAANTGYVVDVDRTGKVTSALEPVITIIDSNTGADLATSQWSGGLHQFLQLKHGCRLSPISLKAVFVSNVAYLKGYKVINGLSGTLGSAEESKTLIELYDADLIKIPTNKPKLFYEHVPVIATDEKEWLQNIYDEICDQTSGKRSVLLICEDIKQLELVLNGLKECFDVEKKPSREVSDCFENITVYKREHDEFNFEDDCKLEPHRLIIATNLAGRGTDIKLSKALIRAGGLHVITAFMPKNCRIEEQAFGRAARCGQPGSAQIIALIEKADDNIQPSVFQLKMFRDNAEVHRLQSLKSFYDFHTEIEEACLEKFRNYSDRALSAISSSKSAGPNDDSLPSPSQIVHLALIDQWALWLDAKTPLINQCAKERSKQAKDTLIYSVDEFLKEHPFGDQHNCFEVAKSWIDAPQSLLTIGIIQMHHKGGFQAAEETFDKVIADGHEFAAEAHYYKGCMRMRNFDGTRKALSSLTLNNQKPFIQDIEGGIEHFYKARTLFLNRLQRRQKEASIVAQLIEKSPSNNSKTFGFAAQQKSIITYIQLIIANIDYLLGAPCKPEMFAENGVSEEYSKHIYDAFYRQGLISPTLLTERKVETWQLEPIRMKYRLQNKQLDTLIHRMTKDSRAEAFDKYSVLDKSLIFEMCPLSTKSDFWAQLEEQKALYNTEIFLVVHDWSLLKETILKAIDQLEAYQPLNSIETHSLVRYSSEKNIGTMYKMKKVEDLMGADQEFKEAVQESMNNGSLRLDKMSNVLIVPKSLSYFSDFDGVTTDDVKEFFHLDNEGAGWILNLLRENGILELQTVKMTRCMVDEEIWKKLVRSHLENGVTPPTKPTELKLLFEHAGDLQKIKDNHKLLNVTEDVLAYYCKLPSTEGINEPKGDATKAFYNYLLKQKILEPYLYNIWRLSSKLDCSSLPSCIANDVDEFLADRFAYTFALEDLCRSLESSRDNPSGTPNQIFLPENPFAEVFDDFVNCGLAMPPRLCSDLDDLEHFDYEDFEHKEIIKSVVISNRLKLYDQTDYHMEITPFASYVADQDFAIDSELRAIIDNGLQVVVGKKKAKAGWWLLNKIVAAAAWCWNKMKSAVSAIASFNYSVVKFCALLPGKIFSKVSEFAAPYVKIAGDFICELAKPLLNTKLGKQASAAAQFIKEGAIELGYKTLEVAEWAIDKGAKVVKGAGSFATKAVNWVAESEFGKGVAGVGRDIGSWVTSTAIWKKAAETATYLYMKMSSFCTAVSESYHYYNQCRTASRRLALEKQGLVDEHVILKAFNGIARDEAKKEAADTTTIETIREHISSSRTILVSSLTTSLLTKLKDSTKHEYSTAIVASTLQSGSAIKKFEVELGRLLQFIARVKQLECYEVIRSANQNNIDFRNIAFKPSAPIPIDYLFFFEDAIDDIFVELDKLSEDEGYESETNTRRTATNIPASVFEESIKFESWKMAVESVLTVFIEKAVDSDFIEPTTTIILAYFASLRDSNQPPSESQFQFNQEDKSLKEALTEYNSSNQSKRKAQFLMTELHSLIHKVLDSETDTINNNITKVILKYGYPIPLSAAKTIALVIDNFLTNSGKYKSGVSLEVFDDQENNKVLVQFATKDGKAKIKMRHVNGVLFLCQADYQAYVGISEAMTEEVDNAFFFEALLGHLKYLRSAFPKQAETLREGLLNELSIDT